MSLADAPLDLSMTAFVEPGPGLLLATARMTTGRAVVSAASPWRPWAAFTARGAGGRTGW